MKVEGHDGTTEHFKIKAVVPRIELVGAYCDRRGLKVDMACCMPGGLAAPPIASTLLGSSSAAYEIMTRRQAAGCGCALYTVVTPNLHQPPLTRTTRAGSGGTSACQSGPDFHSTRGAASSETRLVCVCAASFVFGFGGLASGCPTLCASAGRCSGQFGVRSVLVVSFILASHALVSFQGEPVIGSDAEYGMNAPPLGSAPSAQTNPSTINCKSPMSGDHTCARPFCYQRHSARLLLSWQCHLDLFALSGLLNLSVRLLLVGLRQKPSGLSQRVWRTPSS